jgi:hypothetical protein
MTDDPVRNAAVRKCLEELMTLNRDYSVEQLRGELPTTARFADLSLERRKLIERELRAEGTCSDFDSLALAAFQEALREAVVRGGQDLNVPFMVVPLKEVAERLKKTKVLDLWCRFVKHYLGNIFEWQAVAARVDEPDRIEGMRKYAEDVAAEIKQKAHFPRNQEDVDAFLGVFEAVAAEEAKKAKKAKEAK